MLRVGLLTAYSPVKSLVRSLVPIGLWTHTRHLAKMVSQNLHRVVFVLGPPGSGKGTQCARIQKELGFVHLSAGDLLRAEQGREDSELGALIKGHITAGTIVPVAVTCRLLENAMNASGDARGFLIDGFPRNADNLKGWEEQMNGKVDVRFVLFLSCPENVTKDRCLGRDQGRDDDNAAVLEKRLNTYKNETMGIVEHYRKLGLVKEISTVPCAEEVYAEVQKIFNEFA